MKNKILSIFGFLAIVAIALAAGYEEPREAPFFSNSISFATDTGTTSGTAVTDYNQIGSYNTPLEYKVQWQADSVSGATNATIYLEWTATRDTATFNEIWSILHTGVIDGVQSAGVFTGDIPNGQLRTRTVFAATAQSTTLNMAAALSSPYPQ